MADPAKKSGDLVQILFRGTEDYRFHVQEHARKERLTVQAFLEKTVAAYTNASGTPQNSNVHQGGSPGSPALVDFVTLAKSDFASLQSQLAFIREQNTSILKALKRRGRINPISQLGESDVERKANAIFPRVGSHPPGRNKGARSKTKLAPKKSGTHGEAAS